MATVYSGWVGGDDWQIRLDYSITNINGNTARITCTSSINNRYASVNSGAVVRTTVNGSTYQQTIAPISGSGVKWGAQHSWDVRRNHGDTNYGINVTATMPGSSISSYKGGTFLNASVTAGAAEHHTFTYNANGGTVNGGGTYSNTKWYGENYYIPTLTMSRDGYDFLGWAESSTATSPTKHAGDQETRDQALTFYAVWNRRYIPPAIGKLTATRSDSAGTPMNEGTYAKVSCEWSVDTTLNSSNTVSSVTVAARKRGDTAWGSEVTLTAGGTTSGTATGVVGTFDVGYAYDLRVTVTDPGGTATQTTIVTPTFFTMDVLKGGRGVAFGKAATQEGLDVGMDVYLNRRIYYSTTIFNMAIADRLNNLGGEVCLTDSILNYRFLDIYAVTNDQEVIHTRLSDPFVGMKFTLTCTHIGYSAFWILNKTYQFLTETMCNTQCDDITPTKNTANANSMYRGGNWSSGSPSSYTKNTDVIGIYRIEGLR